SLRVGSFLVLVPSAIGLEHRLLYQVIGVRGSPAEAEGHAVQHIEVHERLTLEAGALLVDWRRHVWGRGVGDSCYEKAGAPSCVSLWGGEMLAVGSQCAS